MKKLEKGTLDLVHTDYLFLGFIFTTILALITRLCMFSFESNDYIVFLSGWFDYLKTNGGILALGSYPGNYNVPYMTIMALLTYLPINSLYTIKFVSVIFDFGLALSSAALVKHLVPKNKKFYGFLTYAVVLFLPEVVLNSSVWAQCDSGYTLFVILALLFLLKEKYIKSFVCLGLAFSLKLQFVFILPLFIVIYIVKEKFSLWHFLIIPGVNFVLCLPAMIMGKPFIDILLLYFRQAGSPGRISENFLNFYNLVVDHGQILFHFGLFITIFVCMLMLIYILYKKVELNDKKILNLGLWFLVIVTFLLPCMHERYLFAGSVLAVLYYIVYRENLMLMVSIIVCAILTYFWYLFGAPINNMALIIIGYAIVIVYYTKDVLRMLCDDKL